MKNQDLTRYLFLDGHEQIANSKGRLVAIRDPERGVPDYVPLKSGLKAKYIQGSIPDMYSRKSSREPQEGELLITGSWFLGWFSRISNSGIKQIDRSFLFKPYKSFSK